LSEERRKELVKVVNSLAEKARIGVRNVREDMLKSAKKQEAEGAISKDDMAHVQKKVQEVVDKLNEEIKAVVADKEKEVMTV
jgi:ribosome recycling factor